MSNEFVARKGLVSLRSSSFAETLIVTGSIYSPAIAYLTASNAITASYAQNGGVGNLTGRYTFSTSTASADPGAGKLAYNSTSSGSVTAIYISETSGPGTDAANYLSAISVGDLIYVQQQDASSVWIKGTVASLPVDNGTWWTIPFTYEAGGSGGLPTTKKDSLLITVVLQGTKTGTYSGSFVGDLQGTASNAISASYALTASYIDAALFGTTSSLPGNTLVKRDTAGATGLTALYLDVNNAPTTTNTGQLSWNTFEGTVDVFTDVPGTVIQVGQELLVKVRNDSGATIPNGSVAYISGSQGNRPKVWLADASNVPSTNRVMGLATDDILQNGDGYVTIAGKVNDLNTSIYAEGDTLYLSDTTPGAYTTTPPTGSSCPLVIGIVTRAHTTQGSILVSVRQGYFTSDERVAITKLGVGVVTASLYGTASYSITSSYSPSSSYAQTASYVLVAQTASYVDSNFDLTYTSISTASQNLATANTWQEIKMNANTSTASLWTHSNNSGTYGCTHTGEYIITLTANLLKTGGGNTVAGVRVLRDGVEITGSYYASTITANNVIGTYNVTLTEKVQSSSLIRVEFGGGTNAVQLGTFPTFGSPGYTYSSKLTITKK